MTSWGGGYVLDVEYTSGFYRELSPVFLDFVCLLMGFTPPEKSRSTSYCEIACGQGFGTTLLAATNPGMRFVGFDFNPSQIVNARRLASEAKIGNVEFFDYSFEEAIQRSSDLSPPFDYIVLHGIYSWISPENRRLIVDLASRFLKPGGVLYVSYNCMPGWAAAAPLQRLIRERASREAGRSDHRAQMAIEFAEKLSAAGAGYFIQNSSVKERLNRLTNQNKNYVAHEYLNGHWHPLYSIDVASEFENARLTYVGSATLSENIDSVSIPSGLQSVIQAESDVAWRETLKDFARNQVFRRDVFLRGASRLTPVEQNERLGELRFALTVPRTDAKRTFQTPLGQAEGQKEIYEPIFDLLAGRPYTLAELATEPTLKAFAGINLLQALTLLVHSGQVHPVAKREQPKAMDSGKVLNQVLAQRIRHGSVANYMALPALGTGGQASFVDLLVIGGVTSGLKNDLGRLVDLGWSVMERTGQRLLKDGKPVQSKDETLPMLREQLEVVISSKVPIWKAVGAI